MPSFLTVYSASQTVPLILEGVKPLTRDYQKNIKKLTFTVEHFFSCVKDSGRAFSQKYLSG
jgi:hypothetical protein